MVGIQIEDMSIYPYGSLSHNVCKLLDGVGFPVTKEILRDTLGERPVKVARDKSVSFNAILDKIEIDHFSTGTAFYTALHSISREIG
jgi:hypothetical protein